MPNFLPEIEAEIEAERIKIKCGTLEMEVDHTGYGWVKIDGKPLYVRAITIEAREGEMPMVKASILPIEG